MTHKIAIVAATQREIQPLLEYLVKNAEQHSFQTFQLHQVQIDLLYSGIGLLQTTYTLMEYLSHRHPDGWIQAGIGGAFDPDLRIGEVYAIDSEMLIGFGAENKEGHIMDPFEMGWNDPDAFPFEGGKLFCPYLHSTPMPSASAMTTFHAHGNEDRIHELRSTLHGQIENMEGASFFYISLLKKIPFVSLRAISNWVEPRDTSRWNIDLAIHHLNQSLIQWLEEKKFNVDKVFASERSH